MTATAGVVAMFTSRGRSSSIDSSSIYSSSSIELAPAAAAAAAALLADEWFIELELEEIFRFRISELIDFCR